MNLAANSAQSFRLNMKVGAGSPTVAKVRFKSKFPPPPKKTHKKLFNHFFFFFQRTFTSCGPIRLQARSVVTSVGDNGMSNSDVFCGLYLSPSAGDINNGDVIGWNDWEGGPQPHFCHSNKILLYFPVNALPFVVGFYSQPSLNLVVGGNTITSAGLPGFRIDYMQVPC